MNILNIIDKIAKIDLANTGIPVIEANVLLNNILNTVYFVVGIVAVIVIIIAGIQFTTSTGDSAKVAKAKNAILYSVIGLVIIMLAFAVTNFVIGRF